MKLDATASIYEESGITFVGFYDDRQSYGISFSREKNDRHIEFMVSDQSCYTLTSADIVLDKATLTVTLPEGTIDPKDGEDTYDVSYELQDVTYEKLTSSLQLIFGLQKGILFKAL